MFLKYLLQAIFISLEKKPLPSEYIYILKGSVGETRTLSLFVLMH